MPRLTTGQSTEIMPRQLTSACAETDTLSARGWGVRLVVPGLGDSDVTPQNEFSLEQEETSELLERKWFKLVFVHVGYPHVCLCSINMWYIIKKNH